MTPVVRISCALLLSLGLASIASGNQARAPQPAAAPPADLIDTSSLAAAEKAVKTEPGSVPARLRYARMLRLLFRFDDARGVMQEAAKLGPNNAAVWTELAIVESMAGNRGVAGSHAQRAVRLDASAREAADLLERLSAAVRMASRQTLDLPDGSAARSIEPTFAALKKGDLETAAASIVRPDWAKAPTDKILRAYIDHIAKVAGVKWLGYELAPTGGASRARLRLLWRVEPARIDFDAIASMPPSYRSLLPLAWAEGLSTIREPQLRRQAIDRARAAQWSDVSVATLTIEDGKIKAVSVGAHDLLGAPLNDVVVAGEAMPNEGVGSKLSAAEKQARRKAFKGRYGSEEAADGDAYRYRQILFALGIVALAGLGLIWLVRREKRKSS